jgi:type IV fimbrial biogenesis protein FimT
MRHMKNREAVHKAGRRQGFTLVEMMVTVAVVAILLAVGAPQLRTFVQKQQVRGDVQTLASAIQLARTEALKRSSDVTLCPLPSSGAHECADATTDWSHGWMVFVDPPQTAAGDNAYDSDTDTLLRVDDQVRSSSLTSNSSTLSTITFRANGLAIGFNQTFTVSAGSDDSGAPCTELVMGAQGNLRQSACTTTTTTPTTPTTTTP